MNYNTLALQEYGIGVTALKWLALVLAYLLYMGICQQLPANLATDKRLGYHSAAENTITWATMRLSCLSIHTLTVLSLAIASSILGVSTCWIEPDGRPPAICRNVSSR